MTRIGILLTVFNRKEKTLKCLQALYQSILPADSSFEVFLTDDASTDGTAEAVTNDFPKVNILKGDGQLFWNRGMINSWQEAAKNKIDYYCWLNDDTCIYPNALAELLAAAKEKKNKAIVCGSTCSSKNKQTITYGGRNIKQGLVIPNGELQICDYFNGNIVLIPHLVYEQLGTHDAIFHHALGDFDYGLRAKQKAIQSFVAPYVLGECDANISTANWTKASTPLFKRLKLLYSPLGNNPIEFFIFEKRHKGCLMACFHFMSSHLRAIFPTIIGQKTIQEETKQEL